MKPYKDRLADAQALYDKPAGPDHETQKFPRGSFVKVDEKMPKSMSHFESGFTGVIEYSYKQKYGGSLQNGHQYSLILLNDSGEPINCIAWYHEPQLTLVSDDVVKGFKVIEKYAAARS